MSSEMELEKIYKNFEIRSVWYKFKALGTYIFIQIVVDNNKTFEEAENDIKLVEQLFLEKQNLLSRFNSDSELSKLNSNLGTFFEVSDDLYNIALHSIKYYKISNGIFDPRILNVLESIGYTRNFLDGIGKVTDNITNSVSLKSLDEDIILDGKNICFKVKIDFSGIAKGYINDMAVSYLKNKNWHNFIVDSGGDLFAAGLNYDNEKWNVLIECSSNLSVELSDQSIATSGITYRKWDNKGKEYYHLINPKNPKIFSTNFQSVSVIKNTTEEADVWAKIIFLMGESAKQYVTNHNIKSIFVYKDGQTWP